MARGMERVSRRYSHVSDVAASTSTLAFSGRAALVATAARANKQYAFFIVTPHSPELGTMYATRKLYVLLVALAELAADDLRLDPAVLQS